MKMPIFSGKGSKKVNRLNIHFGKIVLVFILAIVMIFGSLDFGLAAEPLYYYDRYTLSDYYELSDTPIVKEIDFNYKVTYYASIDYYNVTEIISENMQINKDTGQIELINGISRQMDNSSLGGNKYWYKNYKLTRLKDDWGRREGARLDYYHYAKWEVLEYPIVKSKQKGSYNSTITGTITQYPADGIQGSYWYVRSGLVNQNPIITLSSPVQNGYFGKEVNNKMTISGNIKDSDADDTLKVYYRLNGSAGQAGTQLGANITANGNNQAFSNQITIPTSLADGNHTLFVWVEDNNGGKSAESSVVFRVDGTKPTNPSITVNEAWSKDDVVVTITAGTDGGSGVDRTEYSLSGATTLNWTTIASGGKVTISNEGTTTIKARTIDKVGNISGGATRTVKIDKTAPIPEDPLVVARSYTEIEIIVDPKDNLSGLHSEPILFNLDGIDNGGWSSGKSFIHKGLEPNSKHIYKYKARDMVENISNYSEEIERYTLAEYPVKIMLDDYTEEKALFNIFTNEENKEVAENQIIIREKGKTDIVVKSDWSEEESILLNGLLSDKKYEICLNTRNVDGIESGEIKLSSTSNPPLVDSNGDLIDDFDTSEEEVNPVITILPYETEWTTEDIEVKATTNKGTLNKDSHIFTENGSFTFIAQTILGNITEKEVVIPNIDKMIPEIEINYNEEPTIEDLEISVDIKIGGSGVQSKKWDKGEKDISYFDTNGNLLEATFLIDDNGFITVYVKNGANVETIKSIEITNSYKQTYENAKSAVDKAVETNEDSDIDLAQERLDKIPDIFVAEKDILQTILDTLKSIKIVEDIDEVRDIKNIINTKLDSYNYQDKLLEYLDDRLVVIRCLSSKLS